ncbi:MAG: DNA phosphorothioation system restriction enzyme [Leptolyngbyaceae cyanobacterium]
MLRDFYIPCLERSLTYYRAVGFFSSSSLALAAQGLTTFIKAGGRMRLVASPHLSKGDIEAIESGLRRREEVISDALTRELSQQFDGVVSDRLACLSWLLAHNRLEIKIAVVPELLQAGIYHEKLGIFIDEAGNQVAFGGSANESDRAYRRNFECIDVFRSWCAGDDERIDEKLADFEGLWQNQTPELDVLEFPEAAKRQLLKRCPEYPPTGEEQETKRQVAMPTGDYDPVSNGPVLPEALVLRNYQQQAIANWFANQGRGTLKMATGSGKTITALAVAAALYQKIELQALVVVCPYRHLVQQWARECEKFGLRPVLAFDRVQSWQSELSRQLYTLRSDRHAFVAVITTNATLMGTALQSQLPYFPEKTLIIGDEAHNFGSPKLAASLPHTIGLRLALSATPERYFDDIGTQLLLDYFGPVLQPEFTLSEALQAGALVRYRYYPLLVELTEAEAQRYRELTTKIGQALSIDDDTESNSALSALSMRRAKLIANAAHKLTALRSLMQQRLHTTHTLFYCGDGKVEEAVSSETMRQVDAVTALLGKELGYRVNTYTANTALVEREMLRQQFESGELQGLVAIRCLDEGVDIPATRTAVILASSHNPRQFIQRRGRVLRPAPGKERAEIFDMIVLPPDLERKTLDAERSLLRKELQRFLEFADLADNGGEARIQLLDLQKRYGLLDM